MGELLVSGRVSLIVFVTSKASFQFFLVFGCQDSYISYWKSHYCPAIRSEAHQTMEREAQALVAEHKMLLRYFEVITKRYHIEVRIMIVCVESE